MRRKRQKFESVTREFRHIQDKEGVLTFNLRGEIHVDINEMRCVQLHTPDSNFNFVDFFFRLVTNTVIKDGVSLINVTQGEGIIVGINRHVRLTRDLSTYNCTLCY
jgi:hypothetical protein